MSAIELVYGPIYWKAKSEIKKTQYLSREEISLYSRKLLARTLRAALNNISYYKNNCNTQISGHETIEEALGKFPKLTKQEVSANIESFRARPKFRGIKKNTGGSTGSPFVFYLERFITREKEKAFIFDQWSRIGYEPGNKIFNLRGALPRPGQFFNHDKLFNTYNASSFNLNRETVRDYIQFINRIRPLFFHGYPSTIYQLASLVEECGLSLEFNLKGIFCGSEKLFPYQREKIKKIFQTKVFGWYGHSEYQVLAGECEYSRNLHIYPQYGFTELMPTGRKHVNGKEIYEIIATGFNNSYMPLIRYATKDFATLADSPECKCGRNYVLLDEVIGREQEFIVDKDENLLSITPLIYGQHFNEFEMIDSFQIHQDKIGRIRITVKPKQNQKDVFAKSFIKKIKGLVGDKFIIHHETVDVIPKSGIGKTKTVIQELKISNYISTN